MSITITIAGHSKNKHLIEFRGAAEGQGGHCAMRVRYIRTLAGLILALGLASMSLAADLEREISFDIPAQPLSQALADFSRQANTNVVAPSDITSGKTSQPVNVTTTAAKALEQLLEGTELRYRQEKDGAIIVMHSMARADNEGMNFMRVAQAEGEKSDSEQGSKEPNPLAPTDAEEKDEGEGLTEVIVTGTHIRDAAPVGSPVLVFTQEDIEKSGAATAQQFLAKLPQNFGAGRSEDGQNSIPDQDDNPARGSAVNLRGLGIGATLVLVNGRRSAAAGNLEYFDISMIPLSAVERIEVLTDGSSAIYGSDAIAGVVNFILRKSYSGAQTLLRGGGTTQGGGREYQAAQSFGAGWGRGSVLMNIEHYQKNPITSFQREYSFETPAPRNLTGGSKKNSVYVSANQELFGRVRLFGDLLFTERAFDDISPIASTDLSSPTDGYSGDSSQYGGSVGVGIDIGSGWNTEFLAGANWNKMDGLLIDAFFRDFGFGDGIFTSEAELRFFEAKATGDLFRVPAGNIQVAIGAGDRKGKFESRNGFSIRGINEADGSGHDQTTRHLFAEFLVPVIGGTTAGSSQPRLALSLAGRYEEDSSSSGAEWSSVDPKIGVRWVASNSMQLRATWGESFRAPSLVQTDENVRGYSLQTLQDPLSPTGQVRVIMRSGNNRGLQPETAATWTVGADITPRQIAGLRAQLTYFDIDYKDRVSAASGSPLLVLYDPGFAGVRITRRESGDSIFNSIVAEVLSGGAINCRDANGNRLSESDPCPEPVENFVAILDLGLRNLAISHDRGLDLTIAYNLEFAGADIDFNLNGAYLFDFRRRFTAAAPTLELVSTAYNPTDFRIQAGGSWSRGGWVVTGSVHYNDDYLDNSVPGFPGRIASWTTVDLNMSFDTSEHFDNTWFDEALLILNIENLFDRNPPRFPNHFANLGFDAANSDPYGRTVSVTLRKSW